jgi:hypothetical protein
MLCDIRGRRRDVVRWTCLAPCGGHSGTAVRAVTEAL